MNLMIQSKNLKTSFSDFRLLVLIPSQSIFSSYRPLSLYGNDLPNDVVSHSLLQLCLESVMCIFFLLV